VGTTAPGLVVGRGKWEEGESTTAACTRWSPAGRRGLALGRQGNTGKLWSSRVPRSTPARSPTATILAYAYTLRLAPSSAPVALPSHVRDPLVIPPHIYLPQTFVPRTPVPPNAFRLCYPLLCIRVTRLRRSGTLSTARDDLIQPITIPFPSFLCSATSLPPSDQLYEELLLPLMPCPSHQPRLVFASTRQVKTTYVLVEAVKGVGVRRESVLVLLRVWSGCGS
jgi:hypothetical protein